MPDKLDKLKAILEVLKEDTVSSKQLAAFLAPLLAAVRQATDETKSTAQQNNQIVADTKAQIASAISQLKETNDSRAQKLETQTNEVLQKALDALQAVQAIEVNDGQDGEDGKDGLPGEPGKDGSPDTGDQIVEKINSLPDDPECQIDASHIKNLPAAVAGVRMHGGFRNPRIYSGTTLIAKAMQALKFSGAGVSATLSNDGTVVVTVPGGSGTASDELATDSGDHTTFTILHTPVTATLLVINENTGQAVPSSSYTNTTTSITFNASQQVDDGTGNLVTPAFRARYFY